MSIPRRVRFRTTTNSFGAAAADFLRSRTGCRGSSGAYGGGDGFLRGRKAVVSLSLRSNLVKQNGTDQ
jgi:hypothetical protein